MRKVSQAEFMQAFCDAKRNNPMVREATSWPSELYDGASAGDAYVLTSGGMAGFIVRASGELVALFSRKKGYGDMLVKQAIQCGASHLDCFDGYLPKLYAKHGFIETDRAANWSEGEPDVVFMALA